MVERQKEHRALIASAVPAVNGQAEATTADRPGADRQAPDRPDVGPPLLLTAADLAELLQVSEATIWRLRAKGLLPRPLDALGKQLLRWDAEDFRAWVRDGMPPLKAWEAIKGDRRR